VDRADLLMQNADLNGFLLW